MTMTEKKLNLYTNLFFFFIFIPVLTLVVPTVKWVETRPWLFVAVTVYLIIIYQVRCLDTSEEADDLTRAYPGWLGNLKQKKNTNTHNTP